MHIIFVFCLRVTLKLVVFGFIAFISNFLTPNYFCKLVDPPENTTISNSTVEVAEGGMMPRISCAGNAYPPPQYQWFHNGTVKSDGPILHIFKADGMNRTDGGSYECLSRNKHGTESAYMNISILCKFNVYFSTIDSFD